MTHLAAYTGPSPDQGYVGYVNFSMTSEGVRITVRPESANGEGTAVLVIPKDAALGLFEDALQALRPTP